MASPIGTLYSSAANNKCKRIHAVAAFVGVTIKDAEGYVHYETNKTDGFKAKFPHGKIPAFEGADGFVLFEGSAIARYVASFGPNTTILGKDAKEAALVDQWVSFFDHEIANVGNSIVMALKGYIPFAKPTDTFLRERLTRSFDTLESYLNTATYLVGERVSLADIHALSVLSAFSDNFFDKAFRAKYPNILRYTNTLINHPTFKPIFGELKLIDVAQTVPIKAEKPAKEKAPAAPKQEKPKAEKKKKEDDDDDDEPLVPPEPKAKNPLDSLPKSETFDLEDWKRAYSNKETRGNGGALEYFYEKFDPKGYSIWKITYQGRLKQAIWMSSNLCGGLNQRLDSVRKYAFGSIGVVGKDKDNTVVGVFVVRGDDWKGVLDAAPDIESYDIERIDLENPEHKKFFEGVLAWDYEHVDPSDGTSLPWADGKNFK